MFASEAKLQPQSSPQVGQRPANVDGLVSALKLASWQGLDMWVRDHDGIDYQIKAPIIIGADAVQFASGDDLQAISVPFSHIADFELT
jgi:hypothetical protein